MLNVTSKSYNANGNISHKGLISIGILNTFFNGTLTNNGNLLLDRSGFIANGNLVFFDYTFWTWKGAINTTLISSLINNILNNASSFYLDFNLVYIDSMYFSGNLTLSGSINVTSTNYTSNGNTFQKGLLSIGILQTFCNGTFSSTGALSIDRDQYYSSGSLSFTNFIFWTLRGNINISSVATLINNINNNVTFYYDTTLSQLNTMYFSGSLSSNGLTTIGINGIYNYPSISFSAIASLNTFQNAFNGTLVSTGEYVMNKTIVYNNNTLNFYNNDNTSYIWLVEGRVFDSTFIIKYAKEKSVSVAEISSSYNGIILVGYYSSSGITSIIPRRISINGNITFNGLISANSLNTFIFGLISSKGTFDVLTDPYNFLSIPLNTTLTINGVASINGSILLNSGQSFINGTTSIIGNLFFGVDYWETNGNFSNNAFITFGAYFSPSLFVLEANHTFEFGNLTQYPCFYSNSMGNSSVDGNLKIDSRFHFKIYKFFFKF